MNVKNPFVVREELTPAILELLQSVTLGTNGARYRHLDTPKRIKQLYRPLFLTIERNDKVIGNITFCRRECGWYVRYFAFADIFQTNGKRKVLRKESGLKNEINAFFENALKGDFGKAPSLFYAYIDTKNERSLWMSQGFEFKTIAKIATQTFSRIKPKLKENIREIKTNLNDVHEFVKNKFGNHQLYFDIHTFNDAPFYGLYSDNELIAFAKVHRANWIIERLPGKQGGLIANIIPYVPWVRKIIKPSLQQFCVIEAVWSKNDNIERLNVLFEGILFHEKTNSLIWWVDTKDPFYKKAKKSINWGLIHKLNGVNEIDLVVRTNNPSVLNKNKPFYTTGFDFI